MFERVRIELPGGAGGAEVDVALLYVPRRAPDDKTYGGRHLLSSAWRYVSLTRARWRTYLLLEELEAPNLDGSMWWRTSAKKFGPAFL